MKISKPLFFITVLGTIFSGCNSKPFTLQSYVDQHLNNDHTKEKSQEASQKNLNKDNIKESVADDIVWSSAEKQNKVHKGALQQKLDTWLKDDWEPTFEGDLEQAKKDKQAETTFTLQHYVDKAEKYIKNKETNKTNNKLANHEELNKLPVIGKK